MYGTTGTTVRPPPVAKHRETEVAYKEAGLSGAYYNTRRNDRPGMR